MSRGGPQQEDDLPGESALNSHVLDGASYLSPAALLTVLAGTVQREGKGATLQTWQHAPRPHQGGPTPRGWADQQGGRVREHRRWVCATPRGEGSRGTCGGSTVPACPAQGSSMRQDPGPGPQQHKVLSGLKPLQPGPSCEHGLDPPHRHTQHSVTQGC